MASSINVKLEEGEEEGEEKVVVEEVDISSVQAWEGFLKKIETKAQNIYLQRSVVTFPPANVAKSPEPVSDKEDWKEAAEISEAASHDKIESVDDDKDKVTDLNVLIPLHVPNVTSTSLLLSKSKSDKNLRRSQSFEGKEKGPSSSNSEKEEKKEEEEEEKPKQQQKRSWLEKGSDKILLGSLNLSFRGKKKKKKAEGDQDKSPEVQLRKKDKKEQRNDDKKRHTVDLAILEHLRVIGRGSRSPSPNAKKEKDEKTAKEEEEEVCGSDDVLSTIEERSEVSSTRIFLGEDSRDSLRAGTAAAEEEEEEEEFVSALDSTFGSSSTLREEFHSAIASPQQQQQQQQQHRLSPGPFLRRLQPPRPPLYQRSQSSSSNSSSSSK